VDETDEYVDVHKRFASSFLQLFSSAISDFFLRVEKTNFNPLTGSEWLLLLLHHLLQGLHQLGD
jgi:hypothetical protein